MSAALVSFGKLRAACVARWREWMSTDPSPADLIFTTNELAGEVGEACNVAKKIERARRGVVGGLEGQVAYNKLAEELADVVICAQNSALMYRIDLAAAVVEKFNKTSIEKGLTTMFAPNDFDGLEMIAAERLRQREVEGWSDGHDDEHDEGEIARAAATYAMPPDVRGWTTGKGYTFRSVVWPWLDRWFKPSPDDRIRELVKAGALCAAEIDRLKRLQGGGK